MPAPAPRSYPASSPRASTPARCSSPRASTPASSGAWAGRTSSTVSSAIGLPAPELAGVEALGELHLAGVEALGELAGYDLGAGAGILAGLRHHGDEHLVALDQASGDLCQVPVGE